MNTKELVERIKSMGMESICNIMNLFEERDGLKTTDDERSQFIAAVSHLFDKIIELARYIGSTVDYGTMGRYIASKIATGMCDEYITKTKIGLDILTGEARKSRYYIELYDTINECCTILYNTISKSMAMPEMMGGMTLPGAMGGVMGHMPYPWNMMGMMNPAASSSEKQDKNANGKQVFTLKKKAEEKN